jgi:hypothetical protein
VYARTSYRDGDDPALDRDSDPTRLRMNNYPADEGRIRDIERGWSCEAVVPSPPEGSLAVGDSVVFALAFTRAGQEPTYAKGGDSVRVLLTGVSDLGAVDPVTGRALLQLTWKPLGQAGPPGRMTERAVK